MKKLSFIALIISLSLSVMNFTCNSKQETQATQFADSLAHSISAVHNTVDAAYTNGLINDVDYKLILNDLLTADQAGLNINAAITGIAAGTSTTTQLNAAISSLENALTDGTLHIKDPNTLIEIRTAESAINIILTSIESFYSTQ